MRRGRAAGPQTPKGGALTGAPPFPFRVRFDCAKSIPGERLVTSLDREYTLDAGVVG